MVDVPIQIVNGTNGVTISTADPTSSFWLPLALIAVTSVIAGVTFWYNRKLYNETKKSTELFRTELKAKLRPLLKFTNTSAILRKEGENLTVEFKATINNIGEVPMRKIMLIDWESNNFEIRHLVKEKSINTRLPVGTLQQGASKDLGFTIKWQDDKSDTFYVLWFEYVFLDRKERVVIVFKIVTGQKNLEQTWHVEEDVFEAEKEWQEEKSGKKFAPT